MSVLVELVWEPQLHFIVGRVPAARIGCYEPGSPGDSVFVCENRHFVRVPLGRDRVRQLKELTLTRQQKGSIRSREGMLLEIQSKVRPHKASPSTSSRLSFS
jgi:hypothetical protein